MKVEEYTDQLKFKPICIVLETQEEVDKLHAIFSHGAIAGTLMIGCNVLPNSDTWHSILRPYINTKNRDKWFGKLCSSIKNWT